MWQSLLIAIVGVVGYVFFAGAIKLLMGKTKLDGWELFWIAFAYLVIVGEFWK